MVLGLITFFIISNKLGGLEQATANVLEKNPTKMMRAIDPTDNDKYEIAYAKWKNVAFYNYAVRNGKLKLSEEQMAQANDEFKAPLPPFLKVDRAPAAYAKKNNLLDNLTVIEQNRALLEQDDRIAPESDEKLGELLSHKELQHYPRQPGADNAGMEKFKDKIGNPRDSKNWTLKKARGVYRASKWAPDAPRGMNPWKFLTYFFVPLSVGMFPHLFQHWLTAKSADSFKLAVVAHPIFIMLVWVPCVLLGVWMTSATLPGTNTALIPPHFPPNAVLAAAVKALTSPFVGGLLTAGILAAIMSSLDSQFLCVGTMFTTDIVTHYSKKDRFSDKQLIVIARAFIVAVVALTYLFSLFEPRRVFTLGVWCFSGFSSLFPLIFASLYWRRLTKAGAYAAVIAAGATWLCLFADSEFAANPHYDFLGLMPVATMITLATAAMIIVSLMTKPPSEETLNKFFPKAN